ncbi:DUF2169 family type VI secretion system accessory protein [Roseateles sp. So40a]|uniref:DUF2169 family type VI secretion system accessory protein n=1 Tax=Roseateles sp. So40a TaxID=3400226 RepID=UPI003A8784D7
MELVNLTPFGAAGYRGIDTQDREHEVVAMRTVYKLVPAWQLEGAVPATSGPLRLVPQIIDAGAPPLVTDDLYVGEVGHSSVRVESDLAPFKLKCDVLVTGRSHAPGGVASEGWLARVRVSQPARHPQADAAAGYEPPPTDPETSFADRVAWQERRRIAIDAWLRAPGPQGERNREMLLDKALHLRAPSAFAPDGAGGWERRVEGPVTSVPLLYELAYGGASRVANPDFEQRPDEPELLLNEVCFVNPLGRGWLHADLGRALRDARLPMPASWPAPQIELPDDLVERPDITQQPAGQQPPQMLEQATRYAHRPAGFGPVGRAWTPRIQRAGSYDEQWLESRWPNLPRDFDMAYWNAAPQDQQIAFPRPDCYLELGNLIDPALCPSGYAFIALPGHRASVLFHLESGLMLGGACVIDTLHVDTEAMELAIVWRASVSAEMNVKTAELRFETDLAAPLFKMEEAAHG